MALNVWLLYSTVALVNIVSPGPAILLAISNSISVGPRKGMVASLGNIIGLFTLSATAMLGLGTVLKTSVLLFGALKVLGAGYLIYLGVRQWRSRTNLFAKLQSTERYSGRGIWQIFLHGLLLAVTNPKPILFFTALFPQFITPENPILPQFFILTGTFMMYSFVSLTMYALLAKSMTNWLEDERRTKAFNRIAGGCFVLLGLCLLKIKAQM